MKKFEPLIHENNLKAIIKSAFDMDLSVSGGWGYTQDEATIIHYLNGIPLTQLEHTFASMRAYGEMNMALPENQRYGSINVNETHRETLRTNDKIYEKITYEISAMKEDIYAALIDEYKEGYGKVGFDMEEHFRRRKESTLKREVIHWFDITLIA
ncbi:hypothetical protein [Sulfurovum sp.]|jgi:hypothetical protein|uniref:hypothetical protein n=1 Tax=Sulfurovum sp. TaxID=1969726 RepID=UPI002A35B24C|nr:hypothetical protein [Sulfurovum sp.]MDD2451547.1 hypothetical protein [Sulfurovum sp.]MDD3500102.1 hypothetical protein [Sulfurovum sp.]MDY0402746.1 hypothetical protein [Sulfurovum sp.]